MRNLVFAAVLMMVVGAQAGEDHVSVSAVVDAERAFAKMARTSSMRDAFLTFLADDAVVFRPQPVNGKDHYQASSPSPALLSWEPEIAEISAAGDMGYTSGPWSYRPTRDDEPVAYGHYASIWKKQPDGAWKVVIDVGIGHEAAAVGETVFREAGKPASPAGSAAAIASLAAAERSLADAARGSGVERAVALRAATDVRWYRDGHLPLSGSPSSIARISGAVLSPIGAGAASSGDLGYTWGSVAPVADEGAVTSFYFRIWRREGDGPWRVILDLDSPVPAAEE